MKLWIQSIGVGLLTGMVGLVGLGILANVWVSWFRISSFEGGAGFFVVGLALLGGLLGFVVGVIVARIAVRGGKGSFLKALGAAWGTAAGLLLVAAGISWFLADIPPSLDGRPLMLEVELRLPVDAPPPTAVVTNGASGPYLSLASVVFGRQRAAQRGELRLAEARRENGRWIVPGEVEVFTWRGRRALGYSLKGEPQTGFLVPLPAWPGREFEAWSEWLPNPVPPREPWPDTKPSYRFRIRRT